MSGLECTRESIWGDTVRGRMYEGLYPGVDCTRETLLGILYRGDRKREIYRGRLFGRDCTRVVYRGHTVRGVTVLEEIVQGIFLWKIVRGRLAGVGLS